MRAIDADAFKEYICNALEQTRQCYPDGGRWAEAITEQFCLDIDEQPTIQPEPHWIPVTENCDCDLMDNEEVLVFQKDGTINGQIRHALFYDFNGKKKFVTWEEGITIYNVLAYMPLPEPFNGVTE